MPIVEYFHREPAPEKAGKLPEWASFPALVTAVTVFSFATSSYYVSALANALHVELSMYFSPADYLRITPIWATPTLGFGLGFMIMFGAIAVAFYVSRTPLTYKPVWVIRDPKSGRLRIHSWKAVFDALLIRLPKSEIPRIPDWKTVFDFFPKLVKFSRLLFILSLGLVLLLYFYLLLSDLSKNLGFRTFLDSAFIVFFIFAGASFVPGSAVIKVLFLTICWCVIFAFAAGDRLKPHEIELAPLTRILFESEKDKVTSVEGKVIFDLDRYLLVYTGSNPKSLVAIPHEKIKLLQTPPLPNEQEKLIGGD